MLKYYIFIDGHFNGIEKHDLGHRYVECGILGKCISAFEGRIRLLVLESYF